MGSRGAYRIKDQESISPYIRKQWIVGKDKKDLKNLVKEVLRKLNGEAKNKAPIFKALMNTLLDELPETYSSTTITREEPVDIGDNGIFEIEVIDSKLWRINHLHSEESDPKNLAVVHIGKEEPEIRPEIDWRLTQDEIDQYLAYGKIPSSQEGKRG